METGAKVDDRRWFLGLLGAGAVFPVAARADEARVRPQQTGRDIALLTVHVAGFQYHRGMRPDVLATLHPGTALHLRREPHNEHDTRAIAVHVEDGQRIGYVPRIHNRVPAAMLDQGLPLRARVLEADPTADTWERVLFEMYLHWSPGVVGPAARLSSPKR